MQGDFTIQLRCLKVTRIEFATLSSMKAMSSAALKRVYGYSFVGVCSMYIEKEKTMQEIRYLDKLIDELAKGKVMEKILRS